MTPSPDTRSVLLAGASGYIGRAVAAELGRRGHRVVSLVRPDSAVPSVLKDLTGMREARVTDPESVRRAVAGDRFDTVVSCLASRTGVGADAWTVDHGANANLLAAAGDAGVGHFVLLSALCVQHPQLEFQRAKLAFEAELAASGLDHSIVRPTAFFKSLAGQIPRLKAGRPFVLFGDGPGPACKPISEGDLARFVADCVGQPAEHAGILPIGGPGPAVTPLERGTMLFDMLGMQPRFRRLPLAMFDAISGTLGLLSRAWPAAAAKAELARIGRFYATEPMLQRDPDSGRYDADATPEYGADTLADFYARAIEHGLAGQELGDQALF
ncbi:MAG: NAD(P)H-binding protein [Gammaproteobacteria bacterium]|jgi:divinyl chlorophyllide a 8-vinyl-reductase|nr:NAD(P)H-binding protein [Gammaproteobacteria bacterium]